jgi:hypothetical protein
MYAYTYTYMHTYTRIRIRIHISTHTHTHTHTHTQTHTHITDQPSIPCSDLPVWDAESSIAVKKISKVGAYANLLYDHTLASAFQNLCLAPQMKRYVFPPAHARRRPVE